MFWRNESGATSLEYGLIACLISLAVFAGSGLAGGAVATIYGNLGTVLTTASTAY
jgi:pilus assembly protein Flp/PilA